MVFMIDYKKIGFRCGIEIHQRLNTKKLFCNCDSMQRSESTMEIQRKLRPVASELGGIDPAVEFEFLKNKVFVYKHSPHESCLVEIDEEPPHPINQEALDIGMEIAKMFNCEIPDEIHVMRKTVIDGSNTSGFQRTAIVGMDGFIQTSKGNVGIQSISLEEESARIEERTEGKITYRLSGLGIPLVEIATDSSIQSPDHAKEVAETIGLLLRSTKVQRGIGTIRQDINISIRDGARIEIKGFQELDKIIKVIDNEVQRQLSLLEIKNTLNKRAVKKEFAVKENVTEIFRNTESTFISKALANGSIIHAASLPRFSTMFRIQCGDRTLGKEISSYAGAYELGIIHTDEDIQKYKLFSEFQKLRKLLKTYEDDLIFIIVGRKPEIDKALKFVLDRIGQLFIGVPEETRIVDENGSKYMRPLPGSQRMYPETDIPAIRITADYLKSIKISQSLFEKQKEFEKEIPEDIAKQIVKSKYLPFYEEFRKVFDPVLIASTFTNTFKSLSRDGYEIEKISKDSLFELFSLIKKGKIAKESMQDALINIVEGKPIGYIESRFQIIDETQLREMIKDVVKRNTGASESMLMGILMAKLKGTVSGEKLIKMLRQEMK